MLTCRNSSFPSLWEHWKFVPTWRKSRTRAVYLFMWYITSYIWYIGPVHCLEKQGEITLSYDAIGWMIRKISNYSLGQTHRKDHSCRSLRIHQDSKSFFGFGFAGGTTALEGAVSVDSTDGWTGGEVAKHNGYQPTRYWKCFPTL